MAFSVRKSSSKLIVTFFNLVNLSVTMKPVIILSTYPNKKEITKIAKTLVKRQTIACVNFTKINSIYMWKGNIEETSEFLAIFKTTQKNKNSLKKYLLKTHPYEVPEIAELNVSSINKSYLSWLENSTN